MIIIIIMGNVFKKNPHPARPDDKLLPFILALQDPELTDWKQGMTEAEIQKVARDQCGGTPFEILPHLFLSSAKEARSVDTLKLFDITDVYNVMR